jgi:YVTN family beta-propeller protein
VSADPATGTVYVSNLGSNDVSVIGESSETVTATIAVPATPSGVGGDPAAGAIYVTSYNASSVSIIEESSNIVTSTPEVGADPVQVAVDPDTGLAYVTNNGGNSVSVVTVTPLAVTTTSLPDGIVGNGYSTTLAASGGTTPYTWTVASGSLPTGLSLGGSGVISRTETVAGTFNFTIRAADSGTPQRLCAG